MKMTKIKKELKKSSKFVTPLSLAEMFHREYERLAPKFGYETRDSTKKFDPNSPNGRLMIETCKSVLLEAFGYDWDYFEEDADD